MDILRDGAVIQTVEIDEQTICRQQLMGDFVVEAEFQASAPLDLTVGDYIEVQGEKYYINSAPGVLKRDSFSYLYNVNFEGEVFKLFRKIIMDEGDADFSYFGTPDEFLQLLIDNLNETEPGWTMEAPSNVEPKTLLFNGESCRQALSKICDAFGLEFRLSVKHIVVGLGVGEDTAYTFQYGRGNGLYTLSREAIEEKGVITRLFGFGADKNLSFDYRNGAKRLQFADKYLEANTGLYGVREGVVNFEDIFPNRTSTITDSPSKTEVIDTGIDFDINNYLLEGVTAKIVFKSGALAGYEFDITAYDHATKKITFNTITEANDYTLPSDTSKPEIGDKYTLVNIKMPQSYIDTAEAALETATQEHLDKVSSPQVRYGLEVDEKFVRDNSVSLKVGDRITVVDGPLGVNQLIRVSALSFPLVNPSKIEATISDEITYNFADRINTETKKNKLQVIEEEKKRSEGDRKVIQAYKAIIDTLIVKSLLTNETGQRIQILESENSLKFFDEDENLLLQIDDDVATDELGNPVSGIRVTNPVSGRVSYMHAGGVFSNAGQTPFLPSSSGISTNASLVGLLFDRNDSLLGDGISTAVIGMDYTDSGDGNSDSYGGWFNSIRFGGMHQATRTITANYTITKTDCIISCYNTSDITVTLPASPQKGATYYIRRNNPSMVTVDGNGNQILTPSPASSNALSAGGGEGRMVRVTWDGSYWLWNFMEQ